MRKPRRIQKEPFTEIKRGMRFFAIWDLRSGEAEAGIPTKSHVNVVNKTYDDNEKEYVLKLETKDFRFDPLLERWGWLDDTIYWTEEDLYDLLSTYGATESLEVFYRKKRGMVIWEPGVPDPQIMWTD